MLNPEKIRNIAIIAHVDHGKTTLVDGFLKQSHTFRENQAEMSQNLIMDSGDQERERGITITAKTTAISWNDYKINIIDTPGHADFSGEVERTLNMADGVLLVVDAQEGPMPQTKFVLSKALNLGLKPIVVINKIDKPARRIAGVLDEIANLFLDLAMDDSQLNYSVYFAIAREGKAWAEMPDDVRDTADLTPIFRAIIDEIPAPKVESDGAFQMLVTSLDQDNFLGKYAIGKIVRGQIRAGQNIALLDNLDHPDSVTEKSSNSEKRAANPTEKFIKKIAKIDKIFVYQGLSKSEVTEASAGEIVALSGIAAAKIGDTLADENVPEILPTIEVEAPTLAVYLGPNTSPFKGQEGKFTTSRQIGERLEKELETNVALRVAPEGIGFKVSGRGELHLSVLIEQMRREGYEFEVGRPQVVLKKISSELQEPIEEVFVEVAPEFAGAVIQQFGARHAELILQENTSQNTVLFDYKIPTSALIGLRNILITASQGTAVMNSLPLGYAPIAAPLEQSRNGALIAFETGTTTPYALASAEARGELFVGASAKVYAGQIVGLNNRPEDLEINVVKEKHLTNMRSKSSDGTIQLTPHKKMSLEQCLDFIENDELLEVTPENLRLRKSELDPIKRKRAKK